MDTEQSIKNTRDPMHYYSIINLEILLFYPRIYNFVDEITGV